MDPYLIKQVSSLERRSKMKEASWEDEDDGWPRWDLALVGWWAVALARWQGGRSLPKFPYDALRIAASCVILSSLKRT